jgi:hypothetical protein
MPVQLRFATSLTSEQYVSEQAWRRASLNRCPLHPEGGCGFKRHGSYGRSEPPGARVARWYCRARRTTFSLLPDCLAAKLPGSLAELEQVLVALAQAPSVEAAADQLRPDIEWPGRLRWVRRRRRLLHTTLVALIALVPEVFGQCEPTLSSMASSLGTETGAVLVALRAVAQQQLQQLPPPLGFGARSAQREQAGCWGRQHDSGPRAPPAGW